MAVLLVERNETLKILSLNRPERANSLSAELVEALADTFSESCTDGTRTLVIRGNGKSFCSGFDLSNLENESEVADRIHKVETMLQAVHHAPFLTVALVHSMAFGAGADLVCSCNIRIAEAGSRFCMPGLNFGIVLGTRRLAHRIGTDNAINVLINTRVFDASEALKMGFLTRIVSQEEWSEQIELAKQAGAAIASEHVRQMLRVAVPDTRSEDMADLIESVGVPGLVDRITSYRNSLRKHSGK